MNRLWLVIFCFLVIFQIHAQVNPDDELIPSQGGTNDNPARHKLYTPASQNRVVFQRATSRNLRAIKKKQKELELQRKAASLEFNSSHHESDSVMQCERCFGLGIESCAVCRGQGLEECQVCHGTPPDKCKRCGGEGKVFDQKCNLCEGTGLGVCNSCLSLTKSCASCFGVGHINCTLCSGVGKRIRTNATRRK
jgi:hypothetical protein